MASALQYLVVTLSIICFFFSPTVFSTSRKTLVHHPKIDPIPTGFRVSLKHVDHGRNFTKFERLQRALYRGKHRLQRLNGMSLASTTTSSLSSTSSQQVSTPVYPGNGEFLIKIAIGTPPITYNAIMDTGSDLIWTQCQPCDECFNQSTPIFDPKTSSTYKKMSCSSQLCDALPMSSCDDEGCQYMYSYGDYSSTQGIMGSETFTFGSEKSDSGGKQVSVPNVGFGCGEDNQGKGFDQGAGLVGLGRGPLSLLSQMDQPKFSYCLTSIDGSKTSTLIMGSQANVSAAKVGGGGSSDDSTVTASLTRSSSQPSFYYLNLEGISVGGKRLSIKQSTFALNEDGSGGLIIDSGTTISYFEESAYNALKKEFQSQLKLETTDASDTTGLDLCFKLPSSSTKEVDVPKLVLHFDGGDLDLPSENYMIGDSNMGVACLAMGSSSGMSILGNVQQQNMLVLYDTGNDKLSFVPTKCDEL